MKPISYKGFIITNTTGHGQSVSGQRKTMSIEIREDLGSTGYLVKKRFSVPINDEEKIANAITKSKKLIDDGIITKLNL